MGFAEQMPGYAVSETVEHPFAEACADDTAAERTRLIIRARVAYRPLWAVPLMELMLNTGDLVNVSFMLRSLKRLAKAGGGPA